MTIFTLGVLGILFFLAVGSAITIDYLKTLEEAIKVKDAAYDKLSRQYDELSAAYRDALQHHTDPHTGEYC